MELIKTLHYLFSIRGEKKLDNYQICLDFFFFNNLKIIVLEIPKTMAKTNSSFFFFFFLGVGKPGM